MRYQWDLFEIKRKLQILASDYQLAEKEEEKEKILSFISMYEEILRLVKKKKDDENDLLDDSVQYQDFQNFISGQVSSFQSNDTSILNLILQSYLPFKKYYKTNNFPQDIKISVTDDEVVSVAKDFLNQYVPASSRKKIDPIFDKTAKLLQMSYSTSTATASGLTMIDTYFQEKYIYIARQNKLLDLATLPHEAFHYLITDFNIDKMENYNTYYLQEVEGNFADILFADYFYQNAFEFKNYFNQFRLQIYSTEISDLVINNVFIDALTRKSRFRINKFNKALEVYDMIPFQDKEEIINYMTMPMDINMKYALGYLVAIDLFYIYQKDPEFSFYLLKNIPYMKEENNIIGILRRNHITFMDDGYENLKKYVKKIERQN